jgi:hypothetical protein
LLTVSLTHSHADKGHITPLLDNTVSEQLDNVNQGDFADILLAQRYKAKGARSASWELGSSLSAFTQTRKRGRPVEGMGAISEMSSGGSVDRTSLPAATFKKPRTEHHKKPSMMDDHTFTVFSDGDPAPYPPALASAYDGSDIDSEDDDTIMAPAPSTPGESYARYEVNARPSSLVERDHTGLSYSRMGVGHFSIPEVDEQKSMTGIQSMVVERGNAVVSNGSSLGSLDQRLRKIKFGQAYGDVPGEAGMSSVDPVRSCNMSSRTLSSISMKA